MINAVLFHTRDGSGRPMGWSSPGPLFWQPNYANSALFRAISAIRLPLLTNLDTRPPLFTYPASAPAHWMTVPKKWGKCELPWFIESKESCLAPWMTNKLPTSHVQHEKSSKLQMHVGYLQKRNSSLFWFTSGDAF